MLFLEVEKREIVGEKDKEHFLLVARVRGFVCVCFGNATQCTLVAASLIIYLAGCEAAANNGPIFFMPAI